MVAVATSFVTETGKILKKLGCESTCIDQCTADAATFFSGGCDYCWCPESINVT